MKQERYLVSRPVAPKDKFVKKGNAKLAPLAQLLVGACVVRQENIVITEYVTHARKENSPVQTAAAPRKPNGASTQVLAPMTMRATIRQTIIPLVILLNVLEAPAVPIGKRQLVQAVPFVAMTVVCLTRIVAIRYVVPLGKFV